jgi:hypothetical protein
VTLIVALELHATSLIIAYWMRCLCAPQGVCSYQVEPAECFELEQPIKPVSRDDFSCKDDGPLASDALTEELP